MDLISVIVPVYNSAPYINDCVKSILRQTHTNFELILVDDGSSDQSEEICLELCQKDKRIRFFSRHHRGVGAARNTGMEAAEGKYIFFLDSDDAVHSRMLEYLSKMLKKTSLDVAVAECMNTRTENMRKWLEQEVNPDTNPRYTFLENQKSIECFTYGIPLQLSKMLYGIGGKMIRSDTVKYLRFDEKLSNGEDTKFMYQLIVEGASIAVLYQKWYYYRKHEENSTKNFSMHSYESRHACQRYICDQEVEKERIESALVLENSLLHDITTWYIRSRKMCDRDSSRYIKYLAKKEKQLKIYSHVEFQEKIKFFLAFHCLPIYSFLYEKDKDMIRNLEMEGEGNRIRIETKEKIEADDLISVVVPVFNSSQYVCECVESVLAQTYTYIELILIDDGSEDKSRDMCGIMCKKDTRVRYIQQDHKGVSAARNAGMDIATGKYIFFLDCDDVIHPQLIEMLYKMAESTSAPIASESRYYAKDGIIQEPEEWGLETQAMKEGTYRYLDNENAIEHLISGNPESSLSVIGGKLILREKVVDIRFDENLTQREDEMFLYGLLRDGLEAVVLCRNWYYCRLTECGVERKFSVQSCLSILGVERQICKQEVEEKRIYNALEKEEANILLLMGWYETARKKHDNNLMRCLRNMAKEEKKLWIFSQVSWISKISFYIKFGCHPLYWLIHSLLLRHPEYAQWKWNIQYKNMLSKKTKE